MLKEAIQRLIDAGKDSVPVCHEAIDGREYTTQGLNPIKPPQLEAVKVFSLVSLCEFYQAQDEVTQERLCFHIVNYQVADLIERECNNYGQRNILVRASAEPPHFQFGAFLELEAAIIALQSTFAQTAELRRLIELLSGITDINVKEHNDDGVSQSIISKKGVTAKEVRLAPIITLQPWRTFAEINQPASAFLLRLRQNKDAAPSFALFEADGGAWKNAARESIKARLLELSGGESTVF